VAGSFKPRGLKAQAEPSSEVLSSSARMYFVIK